MVIVSGYVEQVIVTDLTRSLSRSVSMCLIVVLILRDTRQITVGNRP
jgi:hypothetical protein